MHTCRYMHIHTCKNIYMHIYTHTQTHKQLFTHSLSLTCARARTHTHTFIHTTTRAHTQADRQKARHTHTHTHSQREREREREVQTHTHTYLIFSRKPAIGESLSRGRCPGACELDVAVGNRCHFLTTKRAPFFCVGLDLVGAMNYVRTTFEHFCHISTCIAHFSTHLAPMAHNIRIHVRTTLAHLCRQAHV